MINTGRTGTNKPYTPNIRDPRVYKRIHRAYIWVRSCLSRYKSKELAQSVIDAEFGHHSNTLSHWLRAQLLVMTNPYFNSSKSVSRSYRLNVAGYNNITEMLYPGDPNAEKRADDDVVDALFQRYNTELQTRQFPYQEKSNRLVHGLQAVRKVHKRSLWQRIRFHHEYDICCCAPTLLLRRAELQNNQFVAPYLQHYITHRSEVRQQLAQELGITSTDVKTILNGVLFGATICDNNYSSIYRHLLEIYPHDTHAIITAIRNNTTITQIRQDISRMWQVLSEYMTRRIIYTKRGPRKARISASDKASMYRQLENDIGAVIRKYLTTDNNCYYWEHDGFTCENLIDADDLSAHIRRKTNYVVKFEYVCLT